MLDHECPDFTGQFSVTHAGNQALDLNIRFKTLVIANHVSFFLRGGCAERTFAESDHDAKKFCGFLMDHENAERGCKNFFSKYNASPL